MMSGEKSEVGAASEPRGADGPLETNEPRGADGPCDVGGPQPGDNAGGPQPAVGAPRKQCRPLGPMLTIPAKPCPDSSHASKPSWASIAALPCYAVLMVLLGVGVCLMGQVFVGLVVVAFGIVPPAAIVLLASRWLPSLAGCQASPTCTEPEVDRVAAESATGSYLGSVLGATTDELRAWAPILVHEELAALDANRAREAALAAEWLAAAPAFERVECVSDDGARLVGHACACCPQSGKWAVLAHGYRGGWADGLVHARRYAKEGYNLLLIDLRAHGESGGAWVGSGWLDRRDVVAWCQWLCVHVTSSRASMDGPAGPGQGDLVQGMPGDDVRIVLHGTGMGGAAVLMASAEDDLPSSVRACVADSAYSDAWNALIPLLRRDEKTSPHPLVDLLRLCLLASAGGYDVASAAPERALAASRVPALLFGAAEDTVAPPYMAERLAAACGGAAGGDAHKLVSIEGAGHAQAALADPALYYWQLFLFLERSL